MKKLLVLLLTLCLLLSLCPVFVGAEESAELPEGYRWEDMGDFLLPVAPNAILRPYAFVGGEEQAIVAELLYLDLEDPDFQPYMVVWWFPNNMSAYLSKVHPLDYAKLLTKELAGSLREAGSTVEEARAVYGMRRGGVFYMLCTMNVTEGSSFTDGPHELWVYQRWYGTYDMGTYYFEIYAPTREHVDAIIRDVEQVVFK